MSILAAPFQHRSSPENPSFDLNDPEAWDVLGVSPSESGVRINATSALKYAPVWRAVNLISRDVAKLPIHVYRREGDGKIRDTSHPAYPLLRHEPNDEMTAFIFWQAVLKNALLSRGGFGYIVRRGDGTPMEIWPLGAHCTYPVRRNGELWYITHITRDERDTLRRLRPEDVIHIRGLTGDGVESYDMTHLARDSWGLGMGAEKFASRYFRNNAIPGVVLEHPGTLKPETAEKLRSSWEKIHSGLTNAHRTAVLEEGMKAHVLSYKARESQLLELRQHEVRMVANWFGVPPHKLGDTARTSYNSLEQENQAYLDEALDGWLVNIEQECWKKLLTERQKREDTHIVEFLRQALVRADLATRATYYRTATGGAAWMTVNEVRSAENKNPVDGGDELIQPLNMGSPGGDPDDPNSSGGPPSSDNPPPQPDGEPDDEDRKRSLLLTAQRVIITEATGRMLRRLGKQCRQAAKRPKEFESFLDRLDSDHRATVMDALSGPLRVQCLVDGRLDELSRLTNQMAAEVVNSVRMAAEHVYDSVPRSEFLNEIDRAMTETEQQMDAIIDRVFTPKE